jgi:rhodanese-related sulfurtransferase
MEAVFADFNLIPSYFFRSLLIIVALACVLFAAPRAAAQDETPPFHKDTLLNAVRSKKYKTENLVKAVEIRGVDFRTTDQVAEEFRAAGAFPPLIEAMRANYRPPNSATTARNARGGNSANASPPLSEREVLTLLQSGVSSAKVQQIVAQRGVDFSVTPQTARSITQAGGTNALIAAIRANKRTGNLNPPPTARRGPSYDELIERAGAPSTPKAEAVQLLQTAMNLNSARPEAYQLMSYIELYGNRNFAEAEKLMRASIERGGNAVFRVYHDHAKGTFTSYCQGSLYLSKGKLTYEADDGKDSYEASYKDIKDAGVNTLIGAQYSAFHLKVQQGKDSRNYNYAPLTKNKAESNLILALIKSYK